MQPDIIEKFGNSTIQHGKYNDRIYVIKIAPEDAASLPQSLKDRARKCKYSKIFAKVPAACARPFLNNGFECEAQVPRFYHGRESALLLGKFLSPWRSVSKTADQNERVMEACRQKQADAIELGRPDGATLRRCQPDDAEAMAQLYDDVFPTYPFPINDPAYIRQTMASHVFYFGVWMEGRLAALSSAEMDLEARNVEMTDFATLPDFRGQGLATLLLDAMEAEMRARNMATAYTIARAPSFGMNITFARMGYHFASQLVNNTNIGGRFEDMNVWYKHLTPQ
ncbi:MAG: putative beta-lysine N-acetyltransferase [Pirellulales bacterium]|nr:putative beta-lysine N-acetyltransferase [Pirellulales bacterium]